jgi:hypothetical protein
MPSAEVPLMMPATIIEDLDGMEEAILQGNETVPSCG